MFIPQKISIFLKTPKNIQIQYFEPKKMTRAYVCMKKIRVPRPWGYMSPFSLNGVFHDNPNPMPRKVLETA